VDVVVDVGSTVGDVTGELEMVNIALVAVVAVVVVFDVDDDARCALMAS
jgi:hypothetical protein